MNQWINTFNSSMNLVLIANGLLSNEAILLSCYKSFQISGSWGSCIFQNLRCDPKELFPRRNEDLLMYSICKQ